MTSSGNNISINGAALRAPGDTAPACFGAVRDSLPGPAKPLLSSTGNNEHYQTDLR